ncbi:MAG: efflux RND transporter periplasmic adaptor subunit [Phycisphaerales bacterium]|nr:MAG: efflux RND transporter periplasmic adaptor subunit [Phycisphaerales bacterium]
MDITRSLRRAFARTSWKDRRLRLSLVLLAACAAACGGCSDRGEPAETVRPVRVIRVGDTAAFRGREFPGRAEALQHADLSFRVGGTLIMLPARIGARVEEGEVIARLDPRDFEVRVRGGEAALARAQSDLARAQEEFNRGKVAFERGGVSEIEMVRVREALNVARATAQGIEADLQSARDDLADTNLRAPFSGEVAARFVENFEDVQARQPVLRVLDDDRVKFTVFVPESMIAHLPYVREIICEFDAMPGVRLPAEVYEVGREADDVTRTFPITLVMDQPEQGRILAGMTGRASVVRLEEAPTSEDIFDLPPAAIAEGVDGERFVWVIDESTGLVSRRVVEVGPISPAGLRVSGVRRGDVVATAGAAFLREGQRVRVMEPGAARGSRE